MKTPASPVVRFRGRFLGAGFFALVYQLKSLMYPAAAQRFHAPYSGSPQLKHSVRYTEFSALHFGHFTANEPAGVAFGRSSFWLSRSTPALSAAGLIDLFGIRGPFRRDGSHDALRGKLPGAEVDVDRLSNRRDGRSWRARVGRFPPFPEQHKDHAHLALERLQLYRDEKRGARPSIDANTT